MTPTHLVYLDRLSFSSLSSALLYGKKNSRIFYFNAAPGVWKFVRLYEKLGLLKAAPSLAGFYIEDIVDERGECRYFMILEDVKALTLEISRDKFSGNAFLKGFARRFSLEKLIFYFEKITSEKIHEEMVFINAVRWHVDKRLASSGERVPYFIEKGIFSRYLAAYAARMNLRPVEYRPLVSSFFQSLLDKVRYSLRPKAVKPAQESARPRSFARKRFDEGSVKRPAIGAWYTCRTITFDIRDRSDLFWLLKSDIPRERVLMYFDRADVPVTSRMFETLDKEAIKSVALSDAATAAPEVPVWKPGDLAHKTRNFYIKFLIRNYLARLARLSPPPFFFAVYMLHFVRHYSYWRDFFTTTGIKVNVAPPSFTKMFVAKNLALEDTGGVSVSYQWSVINPAAISMSASTDVIFSFGPDFRPVWESTNSQIDSLVYTGYITDYSFKEVRERSRGIRKGLMDKGVGFIIGFFDENSADDRMCMITNDKSARTYEYFLKRLIEDETLGLVFKPGYPRTLFKRLSSIAGLFDKAAATGRCVILDKGDYLTQMYPAEAAGAADLCVGLLLSGTASLEAYLSGTPTIFLDFEKLYSNEVYQWGRGKVVFQSMEEMFEAVRRYRENPAACPGFGDLSRWAHGKDPFKDGDASVRMGRYINWLFEVFEKGGTRREAIDYANSRYAGQWGAENIVRLGRRAGSGPPPHGA